MEKKNSSTVLIFIFGHSEPTESLSLGKVISICTRHKTNTSSLPDKEQTFLADYLSATPAQGDCLQVADPLPREGGCEAGVMCDVEISGVTWRDILLITSCFYCLQRHLCRKARLCPQRDQKMRKCVFGPAAGLWLVKLLILANHRPASEPNTHLRTFRSRCVPSCSAENSSLNTISKSTFILRKAVASDSSVKVWGCSLHRAKTASTKLSQKRPAHLGRCSGQLGRQDVNCRMWGVKMRSVERCRCKLVL